MTRIIFGDRIGKQGKIRLGCSAVLFDKKREGVLLTRRADNGQWCLPSGGVESGESVAETCEREVWEETGLRIRVERLIGVYSNPNYLVEYTDGNRVQVIALNFEAAVIGGKIGLSNETTDIRYFPLTDIENMELVLDHKQRILDTLTSQAAAFIR
jgi:8-oxo-dGTP pyrophosphatase MutT (NUDIX family)